MAIDFVVLNTEITTDPQGFGYAGKSDPEVAEILNLPRATISIDVSRSDPVEIASAIVGSEFTAATVGARQLIQLLVSAGQLDLRNANIRSSFNEAFGAGTTTRDNLIELLTKDGARSEELFGENVFVTTADVAQALGRS